MLLISLRGGILPAGFLRLIGLAADAKELHFLIANTVHEFSCEDALHASLQIHGRLSLQLIGVFLRDQASLPLLLLLVLHLSVGERLVDEVQTVTTLPASVVLLNHTDGEGAAELTEHHGLLDDFRFRIAVVVLLLHQPVDEVLLLVEPEWLRLLLLFLIVTTFLFLALLALTAFLSFLLLATLVDCFLELDVHGNAIVLGEVARHRNLDHGRIVLQIKEKLVQVHVDRALTAVVPGNHVLLDVADARDRAFQDLLDEDAFLRLHNLVVALLEFAVDVDVLDVQTCQEGEDFGLSPFHAIHLAFLVSLLRQMLDLDLLLQIVHGIRQLHIVGNVTHCKLL